ncbi:AAA family ATPase [Flavobacterium ajazii]|uniref:AAA family ATPase n=1 Tax=Flavobacterium ajazii TaxID=2692318 RepID=UPI0013D19A01|nr:AAA family ATPase [Flavobacterium ajazii]
MIQKISINNFGLFKNYSWETNIGSSETFRLVNIIYGRNYSGKTTLSRIFKSIEDGRVHENFSNSNFSITVNGGTVITQNNLESFGTDKKVRVYNTDFVNDNLSWLHNIDGSIKPFTILGAKNVELDRKINELEATLGNTEDNTGLFGELIEATKNFENSRLALETKQMDLDGKLRTKAQNIKNNASLYNYPTYQINTIKGDISTLKDTSILSDDETDKKKLLLKEDSKGNINKINTIKIDFENLYDKTNSLLSREIKISEPIADLLNDSLLQEWVRLGIERHKNKREKCGFCGNPLPQNIWEKIDAHFSKESEDLRKEIEQLVRELDELSITVSNYISIQKDDFYATLGIDFQSISSDWASETKTFKKYIDELINALKGRIKDIFKINTLPVIESNTNQLNQILENLNALVDIHNEKTNSLSTDQKKARADLRISEIGKYIKDIDYTKYVEDLKTLKENYDILDGIKKIKGKAIRDIQEEKRILEAQAKDESKGAELVNQHLSHFFGHDELKLIAEGDSPNIKFKITREGSDAKNLSEGESSLISFCYFIAKMEDEMKDDANINNLIIYIDDPISSLDSNHIFFMYSLIESIIAKPKKYGQLFISTHNLDFLKYLKKITFPEKYQPIPTEKKISSLQHFIIERKGKSNTQLNLAPNYLKNYITEFNYLFDQIYKCSTADTETIAHNFQYNFGNNMRKFLEAYLFYKYPSHMLTLDQRIDKFFEGEQISINLVNRVVNEYSHLGEHFERSLEPIDVDAIVKIARAVLHRIKNTDRDQYDALIESITL